MHSCKAESNHSGCWIESLSVTDKAGRVSGRSRNASRPHAIMGHAKIRACHGHAKPLRDRFSVCIYSVLGHSGSMSVSVVTADVVSVVDSDFVSGLLCLSAALGAK